MIDDQNMLTECYSSWSTNTRKQALILIDCWTTLPKYSESSFELSELSGTLRWQAHFCGDLVIANTTLVLFTAHPYSHAASRPLSQAPLWPIRRTRLALILSISFSSQITLFRQHSYLIIVWFSYLVILGQLSEYIVQSAHLLILTTPYSSSILIKYQSYHILLIHLIISPFAPDGVESALARPSFQLRNPIVGLGGGRERNHGRKKRFLGRKKGFLGRKKGFLGRKRGFLQIFWGIWGTFWGFRTTRQKSILLSTAFSPKVGHGGGRERNHDRKTFGGLFRYASDIL